jgi:hypothetical protein
VPGLCAKQAEELIFKVSIAKGLGRKLIEIECRDVHAQIFHRWPILRHRSSKAERSAISVIYVRDTLVFLFGALGKQPLHLW